MKTILRGTVGSTAYGLNHAGSDVDKLGIFVKDTEKVLSLHPGDDTIVKHDPDETQHEVAKYINLSIKGNPTALELLWLDDYDIKTAEGYMLLFNRELFLSQLIRKTYGGYARQQAERLERRGDFGADLKKRQEKHGRHCARLLIQGTQAITTGQVVVRLTPMQVAFCFEAGELAVSDIERFKKIIDSMDDQLQNMTSKLPERPDEEKINEILLEIRRMNYDRNTYSN